MAYPDIAKEIRDLLVKLKFYSDTKPNQKLCLGNRHYVKSDSVSGSIYRLITGESSEYLIKTLDEDITKSINMLNRTHEEDQRIILDQLEKLSIGINNLITTYGTKPDIKCQLEMQLERLKRVLNYIPKSKKNEVVNDEDGK